MFNELLTQLPSLMKDPNPDLKKLFGEELEKSGIVLEDSVVIKKVVTNLDSGFTAGVGLSSLDGFISFSFKDNFRLTIKGGQEVTLKVDKEISFKINPQGFPEIKGIEVNIPGPIDPNLKSVLIVGQELVIKAGAFEHKMPLPPEFAAFF